MSNPGKRFDPYTAFCFSLQIDDLGIRSGQAFFKSIDGLKSESEVMPYKEGGLNTTTHKLIGPTQWPNLVLKRGFTGPPWSLVEWRQSFLSDAPGDVLRRVKGKVIQLSSDLQPVCCWHFLEGWPCKWEGPSFDSSKSELSIETLEIAHEGLVFEALS